MNGKVKGKCKTEQDPQDHHWSDGFALLFSKRPLAIWHIATNVARPEAHISAHRGRGKRAKHPEGGQEI